MYKYIYTYMHTRISMYIFILHIHLFIRNLHIKQDYITDSYIYKYLCINNYIYIYTYVLNSIHTHIVNHSHISLYPRTHTLPIQLSTVTRLWQIIQRAKIWIKMDLDSKVLVLRLLIGIFVYIFLYDMCVDAYMYAYMSRTLVDT